MAYKCTLCKNDFKDPRLLNCYHSFCRLCLDDYLIVNYEDGKIACPLCKEYSSVPVNGARGLQKNQYAEITERDFSAICDLCNHKIKAISVCMDCDKNLCKGCLVRHVNELGSHNVTRLDLNHGIQTETCVKHKKQELLYYCDTCEKPICNTCNITSHQTHRSKDMTGTCIIFREQLGSALQKLELNSDVNDVQRRVEDQQRKIKAYQEDVIAAIDERTRELHRLVDEARGDFVRKVVSENINNMKQLEKNKAMLATNVAAIEELLKFGRTFLEHSNELDVVEHAPKIQRQMEKLMNIDIEISEIRQKNFYPSQSNDTQCEIHKMFGSFEKSNRRPKDIKSISKLSEFRRTNSDEGRGRISSIVGRFSEGSSYNRYKEPFSCSDGIVTALTFLPDGSLCVCLGNEGILEFFNVNGRRKGKQNFRHPIDDVVADKKGVIYVSSNSEKKIFKVVNYENKDMFAETRTCVRGLAVDFNQSLMAGMTEKSSFFDRQQDGYITEISKEKKIRRIVNNGKIHYPARIAVGVDGRIVVSDWTRLCVFICMKDNVIGTYVGSTNYDKEFIPRGICCLSNGDIVVVNVARNSLHWLSTDGKLRHVFPLDDEPWSVTVDKDDTVWVGTKHGRIIPKELL